MFEDTQNNHKIEYVLGHKRSLILKNCITQAMFLNYFTIKLN